jgi:hypothetical protein
MRKRDLIFISFAPSMPPTYDPASLWWGRQDQVKVWDTSRTNMLLAIPYDFLRTSGQFKYDLVLAIVRHAFQQEGELKNAEGGIIDLTAEPQRGSECCYVIGNSSDRQEVLLPRRGPEGKSAMVKPATTISTSSYSDSKHATGRSGQVSFLWHNYKRTKF